MKRRPEPSLDMEAWTVIQAVRFTGIPRSTLHYRADLYDPDSDKDDPRSIWSWRAYPRGPRWFKPDDCLRVLLQGRGQVKPEIGPRAWATRPRKPQPAT